MVQLLGQVERHMVDLGKVPEGGVGEVEGELERGFHFLVDWDCDTEAIGFEDIGDLLFQVFAHVWFQGTDQRPSSR